MPILESLGIKKKNQGASTGTKWNSARDHGEYQVLSPVDGSALASVYLAAAEDYQRCRLAAQDAFSAWRLTPPPKRGEIVRQIGDALRARKEPLGALVSWEMGKSLQEGLGEVQEMIDICDFAVGLSRQLYGRTMASERPDHRLFEQYHPLGVTGTRIAYSAALELQLQNKKYALITMCVGVGQGYAAIIERV